jgi:hypothetical protein
MASAANADEGASIESISWRGQGLTPCVNKMESTAIQLAANADMRKGTKKPKYIQEPQHHDDHNNGVQNGLNRSLHGNESVD